MHDDHTLVEHRLNRMLAERVRASVHPATVPMVVERRDVPGEPVPAAEAIAADYRPCATGETWGPPWGTTWFRISGRVPREWSGRAVEAVVDLGFHPDRPGFSAEGLVYLPDGTTVKGLNPGNRHVPVTSPVHGGEEVTYYVEAAANPLVLGPDGFRPTALGDPATAGDAPLYRLGRVDLAVFDATVWRLARDLEVLGQLMVELDEQAPRRWEILRAVDTALDRLDPVDIPGTAAAARELLAPALATPAAASAHRISAVGHAHIDSAWLWPLRETVRKVARTTANVTALMDEHPGLVFAMSQAQQLEWLRDHHPDVYARVRDKVAEGRFVPVGGMWVEADTNMPGSEALARQFTFGKRFFREELGIDTREVWLPDSFGYSAALPQLVRLSGSRWFLTQKISWNRTNTFPHHTFWWEGIDGTRVFTHFPPVDTYNAELTGTELAHAVRNFREKGRATHSLVPFGHGDGGGGPTREMLGRADRLVDLDGAPRVRVERPQDFFVTAEEEYPDAPVWLGELYLELHRGTYTSQARTKQGNRRAEHLLREAELWTATAALRAGAEYPHAELDRLWKRVLLNQFHDILPGSSIAWVHREAARDYEEITAELSAIVDRAQRALAGPTPRQSRESASPGETEHSPGTGNDVGTVVFNACPHERDGVPAMGARVRPEPAPADDPVAVHAVDGGHVLDNGLLRVTVDSRGLVTSVLDLRRDREAIPPGAAANLPQLHIDLPNAWDAWDVDAFYRTANAGATTDLTAADEVTVVEKGPDAASLAVTRAFGASTLRQGLTLRRGTARLDCETEVDWHERERFLKVAFPLDVRADTAASEIQFGHVHRPTHTNTTWDAARFETCAHRWVHVGEPGYGHALANDCTYGHDVTRTVRDDGGTTTTVRLSLLRAPRFPDPETDQGVHRFGYALVPGAGIGDAVREGYRINLPERAVPGVTEVAPLVRVDNDAAVVEAVKLADDRSGDVVVRLYEARGGRARASLTTSFPISGAFAVDLLEAPLTGAPRLEVSETRVSFELRPFQILTVRLGRE